MSASAVIVCAGIETPILKGDLSLDLHGNWIAFVECKPEVAPSGAAVIRVMREDGDPEVFTGFIRRGGLDAKTAEARLVVVGGAGQLGALELEPRDHVAGVAPVTAGLVARKIADAAGETLAAGVEAALEAKPLERWTRARGTGVEALDQLSAAIGWHWRMLADGTIWMGEETWPAGDAKSVLQLEELHDDGSIPVALEGAPLRPGTVLFGSPIYRVSYGLGASRAALLYTVDGDEERVPEPGVYAETLAAEVVKQNADGTLELRLDDARIEGLSRVRLDVGIPGSKVTVPDGAEVRVAFRGHSPAGAYAFGLGQDAAAIHSLALVGDSCGYLTAIAPPGGGPCTLAIAAEETPGSVAIVVLGPGHKHVKGVRGP